MYSFIPAPEPQSEKKQKSIRQFIKKNKLTFLTHFTRTDNLKSILQSGILPASILNRNKEFQWVQRSNDRLPAQWDRFVPLNLSFPDYKLFSELNDHKPSDWVILLINIRVLSDFPCYFFPGRALDFVNRAPIPGLYLPEYQKAADLKALFADTGDVKRKDLEIPPFYPTDPMTEILSSFPIAPSYISQVFFHSDYKFNQWVLHNTEFAMTQDRNRWAVGLEFFSPRVDYTHWKTKRK